MKEILHRAHQAVRRRVYLPPELRSRLESEGGTLLVHVSDTPWEIYPFVRRLLRQVRPDFVVHTGDMVDDVKLEHDGDKRERWHSRTRQLLHILEGEGTRQVYVVPGNHDDRDLLATTASRARIVDPGPVSIGGRTFYLDHYGPEGGARGEFDLYGHNRHPPTMRTDSGMLLNGLSAASVIDLSRGRVYSVDYPMDTDRYRLLERSGGGM